MDQHRRVEVDGEGRIVLGEEVFALGPEDMPWRQLTAGVVG